MVPFRRLAWILSLAVAFVSCEDPILKQPTGETSKPLASGSITTIAGSGAEGFGGDGGPATKASFRVARSLCVGPDGTVYVADRDNNRIRAIGKDGTIRTVAGTGEFGYSGDTGAATQAKLRAPEAVLADIAGNLYIADTQNHRVRKVDQSGTITTIAGTGYGAPYSGRFGGDGGDATLADLNSPYGLALDKDGNLFIADSSNNRVRKVDTEGIITTVVGTGAEGASGDGGAAIDATLHGPAKITFDSSGNLYICDYGNAKIRKVDSTGNISLVAGTGTAGFSGDGGQASAAQLNLPSELAVGDDGSLFLVDYINSRLRKVSTDGVIETICGTGVAGFSGDGGPASAAALNYPSGIAIFGGDLYICDMGNNRIRKILK